MIWVALLLVWTALGIAIGAQHHRIALRSERRRCARIARDVCGKHGNHALGYVVAVNIGGLDYTRHPHPEDDEPSILSALNAEGPASR